MSASRTAKLLRSSHPTGPVAISPRRATPTPSTRNGGNLLITADEDGARFHLEFTSSAFAGTRPAVEGAFTPRVVTLPGRQLSGEVVRVGWGCPPGGPAHRRDAAPTLADLPARLL